MCLVAPVPAAVPPRKIMSMSKLQYEWRWEQAGGDRTVLAQIKDSWAIEFRMATTFNGPLRALTLDRTGKDGLQERMRPSRYGRDASWDFAHEYLVIVAEDFGVTNPLEASVMASELNTLAHKLEQWDSEQACSGLYPGIGENFTYLEPKPEWLAFYEGEVSDLRRARS